MPDCFAFSARNFAMFRSSMSLPLRYSSASTNTRFSSSSDAAVGHVDDVLQRLQRLAAMPHEQLGFLAGQVEPRAVGGLFDVDGRRDRRARR